MHMEENKLSSAQNLFHKTSLQHGKVCESEMYRFQLLVANKIQSGYSCEPVAFVTLVSLLFHALVQLGRT